MKKRHVVKVALSAVWIIGLVLQPWQTRIWAQTPANPSGPESASASASSSAPTMGGPESVSRGRYQQIIGTRGMVVSDDREASEWGAEILRQGGNAVDAAVATAFALSVTRPHYASIGGGGFLIFCPRPGANGPSPCQVIDYREKAPAKAHRDMFVQNGKGNTTLSQDGALASGVPGVPAGLLLALEKFGSFSRQKVLKRPIEIAKKGYLFTSHSERAAFDRWSAMNEGSKQIFGCSSKPDSPKWPCPPGTRIIQKDLAQVLEKISALGRKGFYEGPVAEKLIKGLSQAGGVMTLEDLKSYEPTLRTPLRTEFQGHEVITMPPPSSGGMLLIQLLGYADRADRAGAFKDGWGSSPAIQALIHGMSLAFADRASYLGDPEFVTIPLATLLSSSYLDQQWKTFETSQATLPKGPGKTAAREPQFTTHFSVVDRHGNSVSLTTTVNDNFGSGFVPPGTGIVMNNEMDDFSVSPGTPNLFGLVGSEANAIAAHKRPLSSMTPTVVRDLKGNTEIVIGAAGGPRIATSVFLSLLNRLRFGMTLADSVAASRIHQQWKPEKVFIERFALPQEIRSSLEKKGYEFEEVPGLGKVHALERLTNGRTSGAADFRGEGAAVPE